MNPHCSIVETDDKQKDDEGKSVKILSVSETNSELLQLKARALHFSMQLNRMRANLRFSILALLSENKFNIFNRGLIDFMAMLNNGGWSKDELTSEFGAYLIDHITLHKDLDYKDDTIARVEALFTKLASDAKMQDDYQRLIENLNILR